MAHKLLMLYRYQRRQNREKENKKKKKNYAQLEKANRRESIGVRERESLVSDKTEGQIIQLKAVVISPSRRISKYDLIFSRHQSRVNFCGPG